MKKIVFLCGLMCSLVGSSQSIVGSWKTIDDHTGKVRSVVEIEERNGNYFGRVIRIFTEPGEDPDPICDECPGKRKNERVMGMEIIQDMSYVSSEQVYSGGEILDPESGNVYDCKLWIGNDGSLSVRGYVMFFYRTQTWLPYNE